MESGTARDLSASATAFSLFGFANENSSEMAMDCGLAAASCSASDLQFLRRGSGQDFAVAGRAFVDAEAEILGDQRLDAVEEEVVELGAGLASDFDGVFEAGGGDEGGAGAFAFEQRVGADGGAVEEDEFAVEISVVGGLSSATFSCAIRRSTSTMAWEGSAGVEKTFSMRRRPASIQTQSVKVPPVSMAMRRGWERRGMSQKRVPPRRTRAGRPRHIRTCRA